MTATILYKQGSLACAAGCFIADDEYSPKKIEGLDWHWLIDRNIVPSAHGRLIQNLQRVHDNVNPKEWKEALIKLAIINKFDQSFI